MKKLIAGLVGIAMGLCPVVFADFGPQQAVTRTPTEIRTIEIMLFRTIDPNYPAQSIEFRISINDQFGRTMRHQSGDLIPHLTTQQKNQLINFMDMLWLKAKTEILP